MRGFPGGLFGCGLAVLVIGCAASSGTGVPDLEADDLVRTPFATLEPRELSLKLVEQRAPVPEGSAETLENLRAAVSESLRRSGLTLRPASDNTLTLTISFTNQPLPDFSKEDCVKLHGEIRTAIGQRARAEGTGCYEYRHALGFSMGGDATRSYVAAVNYVLEQLDGLFRKQGSQALQRSPRIATR